MANARQLDVSLPPFLSWGEFLRRFEWRQGEHVALIGPTGAGKTTLATNILPKQKYVTALATKPRDEVVSALRRQGYFLLREWRETRPDFHPDVYPRRILWPNSVGLVEANKQRKIFLPALHGMFREGGWTIFIDETTYFVDEQMLKLRAQYRDLLARGRSVGISVVSATQRPAYVPREMYDQSTHLFFWQDNDEANLDRLSSISYVNRNRIKEIIPRLPRHETLYVNTRTGIFARTQAVAA